MTTLQQENIGMLAFYAITAAQSGCSLQASHSIQQGLYRAWRSHVFGKIIGRYTNETSRFTEIVV